MRTTLRIILYGLLGIVWTLWGVVGLLILFLADQIRVGGQELLLADRDDLFWQLIGFGTAAILALILILIGLRWLIKQPLKTLRNMSASELVALRDSESPRSFSLYLRPFGFTNVLKTRLSSATPSLTEQVFLAETVEFEDLLFKGLVRGPKLIALGRPGEHLGAGRILTSDDAWQALAADLIDKAQYLILIPSTRPGTLWEIDYLKKNGHLPKTLIILPQSRVSYNYDSLKRRNNLKGTWRDISEWRTDAVAALQQAGLPAEFDANAGFVLRYASSGDLLHSRKFLLEDMDPFWEEAHALMAGAKSNTSDTEQDAVLRA